MDLWCRVCVVLPVCLALILTYVWADILSEGPKRSKTVYCGACLALAQELEWYVGTTSEKQHIETGGFRIDSNGNLVTKKVPLKRSEIHLNEIFDYICRRMSTYNEAKNEQTGAVNYIPSESRDGVKISTKGVKVAPEVGHSLEFACDTILEHYEDQLIKMFQDGSTEIGEDLCVGMAGLCSKEQHKSQMQAFAELKLNDMGNPVNTDVKKDTAKKREKDNLAQKMQDLRDSGLEMYSRDDIDKLMADLGAETREANPTYEGDYDDDDEEEEVAGDDDEDWEYGIPPPPTDKHAGHEEL